MPPYVDCVIKLLDKSKFEGGGDWRDVEGAVPYGDGVCLKAGGGLAGRRDVDPYGDEVCLKAGGKTPPLRKLCVRKVEDVCPYGVSGIAGRRDVEPYGVGGYTKIGSCEL